MEQKAFIQPLTCVLPIAGACPVCGSLGGGKIESIEEGELE